METLTQLKNKSVKIGLVTNGLASDYQLILRKLKLTNYFDVTVDVESCNKGKTETAIFLYTLNKLNVSPSKALFVGDSIKYDYEGAKRAGLKPLLIDRDGKAPKDIDTIKTLTEVLSFI